MTHTNNEQNTFNINDLLGPFQTLEDPRKSNATRHIFGELLFIALAAVVCGAEGFTDMERFGKAKKDWLEKILQLPKGLPSHDAFGDIFSKFDPEAFNQCFIEWTKPFRNYVEAEVVALDGKSARRSHDKSHGIKMIHTVSAWASSNKLVLGQLSVAKKSNEITAIPKLLELLDLEGCIVTIDAMGTQKEIAAKIVEKKADYILALKDNQKTFHQEVKELFADEETLREFAQKGAHLEEVTDIDKGHGRIEIRRCVAIDAVDWFREYWQWKGLHSLVMVESIRQVGDERPSTERRYFISTLPADTKLLSRAIRMHWGIENSLHWVLDVTFREDESRVRKGHAAKILSMVRKLAINLLQNAPGKDSIKGKQRMAGWNHEFLLETLRF